MSVPTRLCSYLELMETFREMIHHREESMATEHGRYQQGLHQLHATELAVMQMQTELEELQPVLKQTSSETAEMIKKVAEDSKGKDPHRAY